MITLKIIACISVIIDLILIVAYIETHAIMRYYKKQFHSKPRAFRYVEKYSWQRRVVDYLLLRRPVSIKQPFKLIDVSEKKFSRMET